MTEKEKCAAGLLYRPFGDEEMMREHWRSRELCFAFNQCPPSDRERREAILRELIGEIRGEFTINEPFRCDYGRNIILGERFFANYNCVILDCAKVTFGDDVLLGPNCCFTSRRLRIS